MTPPPPGLAKSAEVGRPHKANFSKGAEQILSLSHREFKASQLRNLNSVVLSASSTSLACKTFPAKEATLFTGKKKSVIFLT